MYSIFSRTYRVFWPKQCRSQQPVSRMDFQLARNLSAIARAQEEIPQALLHIDSTVDCLNREIIMSAQISFITERRDHSSSTSASHASRAESHRSLQQQSGGVNGITERAASEGHSYAHTTIRGGLWRDDNSF